MPEVEFVDVKCITKCNKQHKGKNTDSKYLKTP